MKIGILTHYNVSSHGALLQLYAMQQVLQEMGHDVFVLTYNKNFDLLDEDAKKRFSASLKNIPYYLKKYMGEDGFGCLVYQYKKQKILSAFRKKYFSMIPYTKSGDLDCVIVGADEVFSLENGIDMMMFGHGITSKRIIGYAPSFGQTNLDRIEKFGFKELIQSGFRKFNSLSARDEGTRQIIETIQGMQVPIVCDPALLYKFSLKKRQVVRKKYIVVYSYQSNFKDNARNKAIIEYARKTDCELWSVGVYYKWCDKHINCNPLEMLQIFHNAELIITDTFHGTISACIVHTPMVVFARANNSMKIDHLLKLLSLEDRKAINPEDLNRIINKPVQFDAIDSTVDQLRFAGKAFLTSSLR